MKMFVRALGAMLVDFLGAVLVWGGVLALGVQEQIMAGDYATLMLFGAMAGLVASLLVLAYAASIGGVPLRAFSFEWNRRDGLVLLVLVGAMLGIAWGTMLVLDRTGAHPFTIVPPRWSLLAIGVVGALGTWHEEVQARGYVMALLRRRFGIGATLIGSALLFTLMHIPARGVSHLILTWLLAGLVYGYVYLKSGSLPLIIIYHAAHNFIADLLLYSDNGVSLLQFATPLTGFEKTAFELVLAFVTVAIVHLAYGRDSRFLQPSPRLIRRWASAEQAEVIPLRDAAAV
jgi:membrane protease YdiL (CAAX protease family)